MRRARGWPMPPAAPRTATLRSGLESEEKDRRRRWVEDGDEEEEEALLRVVAADLNIDAFIFTVREREE